MPNHNVTAPKQNKGEWSEFYALIRLLSQGVVDMETSTDTDRKQAKVLSVSKCDIDFRVDDEEIISSLGVRLSREELRSVSKKILNSILSEAKVFNLPEAVSLSKTMGVSSKRQTSSSIADLSAIIRHEDRDSQYELSIKSWLGARPSFFNASKLSTRIHYKICGEINSSILEKLDDRKATENIKIIYSNGGWLEYIGYGNENFEDGLNYVGNDIPQFFAELVVSGFLSGLNGLENTIKKELPSIAEAFDYFKSKYKLFTMLKNKGIFEVRLKNLLYYILLYQLQKGQPKDTSATPDNYLAVLGGGDLLCIVGRAKLQEKLFQLCKLDSPASGENKHDYGFVFKKDDYWAIDLQPGIRLAAPK